MTYSQDVNGTPQAPRNLSLKWNWLATVGATLVVAPWLYLWWADELSEGSDQPSLSYFLLYLGASIFPVLVAAMAAFVGGCGSARGSSSGDTPRWQPWSVGSSAGSG